MILHVAGTMVPGSPSLPEYLKANVYLPPSLVNNHPELHPSILRITQEFLETIGVTTVQNWRACAKNDLGFNLNMPSGFARPNGKIYDVPAPQFRSSHYIIHGQPMGASLDSDDGPRTATTPVLAPTPSPSSSGYSFENMDAQEQVYILSEKLSFAQQHIRRLEAQLELFSGLDEDARDAPHQLPTSLPTPTRNTSVMAPESDDFHTSSPLHQRRNYPDTSRKSPFCTPRKGRVADIGLATSPLHSTSIHPLRFTSMPSTKGKGKMREEQEIKDSGAEPPLFKFTALVLQNYDLFRFLDQVLLIIKVIPEADRLEELVRLHIPEGVVSQLLTAISMDKAQMD
jgi:hypothetical protein